MDRLYTIGHSSHELGFFFDLLRKHDIKVLLDVRSAPYSKWVPHFNRERLELACKDYGVEYRYAAKLLGGRPEDADMYKDGQRPDASIPRDQYFKIVDYLAMMKMESYQKGIKRALEIVQEQPAGYNVTIMCSEGEPLECHRHYLIARSLIDPAVKVIDTPVEVVHILKDGSAEVVLPEVFEEPPQQMSLF